MNESLTVHIDHALLHVLFSIKDPSVRLISWRFRLAEFDFERKYDNVNSYTKAIMFPQLYTMSETITYDGIDAIPVFILHETKLELERNRSPD